MNSLTALSRLLSLEPDGNSNRARLRRPAALTRASSVPAIALQERTRLTRRPSLDHVRDVNGESALLSSDDEDDAADEKPPKPVPLSAPQPMPVRISIALLVLIRKLLSSVGIKIDLPAELWSLSEGAKARLPVPPLLVRPSIRKTPATPTKSGKRLPIWKRALDKRKSANESEASQDTATADASSSPSSSRRSSFTLFGASKPAVEARHHTPPVLRPKTLILDLDETLIHSTNRIGGLANVHSTWASTGVPVRLVEVVLDGRSTVYHVYKRPWVDFFLKKVATWYTVVIFTASMQEYADPVIDWLDQGRGLINGRFFRESCVYHRGTYYKDLTTIDEDLSRVCLVDNSPSSYAKNPANGIPIEGWVGDKSDECLLDLLPLLDSLRFTTDVRRVLGIRGFGVIQAGPVPP